MRLCDQWLCKIWVSWVKSIKCYAVKRCICIVAIVRFFVGFGVIFLKMVPQKEPGLVITPSTCFIEAGQKAGQIKSASDNFFKFYIVLFP